MLRIVVFGERDAAAPDECKTRSVAVKYSYMPRIPRGSAVFSALSICKDYELGLKKEPSRLMLVSMELIDCF